MVEPLPRSHVLVEGLALVGDLIALFCLECHWAVGRQKVASTTVHWCASWLSRNLVPDSRVFRHFPLAPLTCCCAYFVVPLGPGFEGSAPLSFTSASKGFKATGARPSERGRKR